MISLVQPIRALLSRMRQPTAHAARIATRFHRATVYGMDLVLWSRLLSSRRSPIPVELPRRLLESKNLEYTAPVLQVSGPSDMSEAWEGGFAAVNAALFLNLQMPDVLSRLRYAHPAPAFKGIYLWDSAFVAQVWKPWDPAVAHDILQAVLELRDGDRLQHVVADLVSSPYTQPPLMTWSLAALLQYDSPSTRRDPLLGEQLDLLGRYQTWLQNHRRHPGGLYFWKHAYESGVENAPRFGSRDERQLCDTSTFASPDFGAYVVLQLESLAELAQHLNEDHLSQSWLAEAHALRKQLNAFLWHEEDGIYYDREFNSGSFIRTRTIAGLLPLWAGVPDKERASRMLTTIMDPGGFNTLIPLPSVARSDPSFEPDMWRGPVWINTAYAVLQGMHRYGFHREAADLAWRLCDGVYRTHFTTRRIFEFYDPDSHHITRLRRKDGNRWKSLTLGNSPRPEFVGWSGLVNTLLIERLIGIQPRNGNLWWQPRFPASAAGRGFALRLPSLGLSLQLQVLDPSGRCKATFLLPNAPPFTLEAAFGQELRVQPPSPD